MDGLQNGHIGHRPRDPTGQGQRHNITTKRHITTLTLNDYKETHNEYKRMHNNYKEHLYFIFVSLRF